MRTIILLLLVAVSYAQNSIPAGTILPVQLNSSLRSEKARVGDQISARLMQDVALSGNLVLHHGAMIVGQVISVLPPTSGRDAEISFFFHVVAIGQWHLAVATSLRALASRTEVSRAKLPETGADQWVPADIWTTTQIGGELDFRGGGAILHGSYVVGHSVSDGVLVQVSAVPGSKCRSGFAENGRMQALWVFSSDACGLYDLSNLTLTHAGRTVPVGQIVPPQLEMEKAFVR